MEKLARRGSHVAHYICTLYMPIHRTHILFPEDLIREIDDLVGPRGRSAFLVESARQELRRQQLLRFLESDEPAWEKSQHPELANGPAAWVRKMRRENERVLPSKRDTHKKR